MGYLDGGPMKKETTVSEMDVSTPCLTEETMEPMAELMTGQSVSRTSPTNPCTHGRAIEDVFTRSKKQTGQVRCLECGMIFDDPSHGQK